MIINDTKDIEYSHSCYLYWIRKNTHKDMFTEGYIGITNNPSRRLIAHNNALKNYKPKRTYYTRDFLNSFNSEDLLFSVIDCGSIDYIQNKEFLLRPVERVGWNIAVGGNFSGINSNYKHGGVVNQTLYNKFAKFLDSCQQRNLPVDFNFLTDSGFKLFAIHLEDRCIGLDVASKVLRLVDDELGFTLGNFYIEPIRSNSDHSKWVFFNNRWWSKLEACCETGVNVKTAEKRLSKYGMTREEAVGFVKRFPKNYEIVYLGGVACKYNKSLTNYSKEELVAMYNFYQQRKRGFKYFCKSFDVEAANMIRYFKRYGLNTDQDRRFKDFRDGEYGVEY